MIGLARLSPLEDNLFQLSLIVAEERDRKAACSGVTVIGRRFWPLIHAETIIVSVTLYP